VLQLKQVEKPIPVENEVLIMVKATTVNRTDCAQLRAQPFIMRFLTGLLRPKRPILGTAFAGTVVAVGKAVVSFKIGDDVFGFDDLGVNSHAQYMTLSVDKALTTIPAKITYEQAAASIEGEHYAYNMINKINLKRGQLVLVNGATGAIGSAAVQLLKHFGAEVVGVCDTKNIELVKSLGADKVIDYLNQDFTTEDHQYDYIFDAVGKSTFAKCKPLLKPGGVYISSEAGAMAQNILLALFTPIFRNKKVIFPIPLDIHGSLILIKKLLQQGIYKPVIDRTYTLEKIKQAYRYVESGQKIGNVVITVEHDESISTDEKI
jgi:NADPH:quinone reductase-like Zn-dependent oxidoreductase